MKNVLGLFLLSTLIILSALISPTKEKKICITIDDLPLVTYGLNDPKFDSITTAKLIQTFKTYHIPAMGYVVEGQLYENGVLRSDKLSLLETWVKNGYDLGNHTYSHYDYNRVSTDVYFNDILKGEVNLRPLLSKYGKKLVYFRHPFLHTGADKIYSDSLSAFLKQQGYTEAPVTLDTDDYYFAQAYHRAYMKGDTDKMLMIGETYLLYMKDKLDFYESKSQELFGRSIPQTLLIHANLLNADYLDELAMMYQEQGYTFISQQEVLKDKAYAEPVRYYTKKGISWIFRWAYTKGKGEEFTYGDIALPSLD